MNIRRHLNTGWVLWATILFGTSLVLCFVPLFHFLGYESCLVLSVLGTLASAWQGANTVFQQKQKHAHTPISIISCYGTSLVLSELFLGLPLLVLSANGFRTESCNYLGGLHFFVMMPVLSIACGAALGTFSQTIISRLWASLVFCYIVIVTFFAWSLLQFLASPAIFLYNPFFGYFPGAIYDENISISVAFYAARCQHILWTACFLLFGSARVSQTNDKPNRNFFYKPQMLVCFLLFCGATSLFFLGDRLGIYTSTSTLHSYLDLSIETPHFSIRYREGKISKQEAELLAKEAEIDYLTLKELLGLEPTWQTSTLCKLLSLDGHTSIWEDSSPKIQIYAFRTAQEKKRWMGAENTFIAKPWRREIYLQIDREFWPFPVLKHELAHIFSGAIVDSFLHLPFWHGLPNAGMIEGFAVAADWPLGPLDIHQQVKALRQLHLQPSLSTVMSPSFFALPKESAYVVSGSFLRYLLERFGKDSLLQFYKKGGTMESFTSIYPLSFSQAATDWERFIDEKLLPKEQQDRIEDSFLQKTIFQKVCAHQIATLQATAQTAISEGRLMEASRIAQEMCIQDPNLPEHLFFSMELSFAIGDLVSVKQTADRLLHHPNLTASVKARTLSRLGDLCIQTSDLDGAKAYYKQAYSLPVSDAEHRLLTAKLILLQEKRVGMSLLQIIVGGKILSPHKTLERTEPTDVFLLAQACTKAPEFGLCHYLLGRRLFQNKAYLQTEESLQRALALPLDSEFIFPALLLLGQTQLLLDLPRKAEATFQKAQDITSEQEVGQKRIILEWRARAKHWDLVSFTSHF